jgi:hypothetical protein
MLEAARGGAVVTGHGLIIRGDDSRAIDSDAKAKVLIHFNQALIPTSNTASRTEQADNPGLRWF